MIQRYTDYTGTEFGSSGKLSENGNYFLTAGSDVLYVAKTATAPRNSARKTTLSNCTNGTKEYEAYVSEKFFKDCLHTAEEIINAKKLEDKSGGPASGDFSKVSSTGTAFGASDAENITAAKNAQLDDAANPGLGNAYVIVNTKWTTGGGATSPYHAAAVVAVDGNDRITLEVFANTQDAKARNTAGVYGMYATGSGSGSKFHSFWQKQYFGKDSITTVIEKV
jgi:hypothetical protein